MSTLAAAPTRAETVVELAIGAGVPAETVGRLAEAIARASGKPESPELRALALDAEAERYADRRGIVPNVWHGANERYAAALQKLESEAMDADSASFASAVESFQALQAQRQPVLERLQKMQAERASMHAEGEHHLRQMGHFKQAPAILRMRVESLGDDGPAASVFDLYCRAHRIETRDRLRIFDAIESFQEFVEAQNRVERDLAFVSRQMADLETRYPQLARLREVSAP